MVAVSVTLLVCFVIGAVFIGGRLIAQNARKDAAREVERLRESLAWHEERLRQAKLRGWDYARVKRISDQLDDTRFQLLQLTTAQAAATRQSPTL